MKFSANTASFVGVLSALAASVAFSLNDIGVKYLSGDYPLHEVVLIRSVIAICLTLLIFMPLEGGLANIKTKRLKLHLLRGLFVVCANFFFFLGLASIPLSEATAIFFIAPVIITVFSAVFLGETVGPWRWFAVCAGLVGAIIMLRPTPGNFQWASLLPMLAAFCYASLHMLSRKIGTTERASTMSFYIQLTFIVVSAIMGLLFSQGATSADSGPTMQFLLRPWIVPSALDLLIMSGIGVCSAMGGYFISQAYRLSEAALIAPIEYVSLVLAIIWGITLFSEKPDVYAWIGIALILGGGLFMLWREHRINHPRPPKTRRF